MDQSIDIPGPIDKPASIATFQHPALSLWQASVHQALVENASSNSAQAQQDHAAATADHPYMAATVSAMQGFAESGSFQPSAHRPSSLSDVTSCAKLYAELAWNKVFQPQKARQMQNELDFSTCDPFWVKCLLTYDEYLKTGKPQPYMVHSNQMDYVVNCLPDKATVALIADWGTGMDDAVVLAQQIAKYFKPDVLIHLGDIYYAGLPAEIERHFLQPLAKAWPVNPPLIFALDGNHDRYAGSNGGYYSLIANLNQTKGIPQPNSYFALRNNFWQVLALDTGYHDCCPRTESKNLTFLEPTEVEWHLDKVRNSGSGVDPLKNAMGKRGTVLLSHHQLLSFLGTGQNEEGKSLAVNYQLAQAFQPVFGQIDFWLWGHEHNLCIFEPYTMADGVKLPRGRCIGAGAVPNFISTAGPANLLLPPSENAPPRVVPGTNLRNNGTVDNHAYSIVRLDGPSLTIEYYQFDSTKSQVGDPPEPEQPTYVESARLTKAAPI